MRVLLTGASGLVGGAVARLAAGAGHEVTGIVGTWTGGPVAGAIRQWTGDLTRPGEIDRLVAESGAEAIVNAAAISEPVRCDERPLQAEQLNVALPERLAQLAAARGARFIHLSSEQVFDGTAAPYAPGDPVRGVTLYARQKIAAERHVHAAWPAAATLRLPLLLGNSPSGRRSAHERLLALWQSGGVARLYADEIRQPCTADSVARVIVELLGRPELAGVFHWAGAEPVSRLELGRRIRAHFGLSPERARIVAVERKDDPVALATRPADLSFDLEPLNRLLVEKPRTFAESLAELRPPDWWQRG